MIVSCGTPEVCYLPRYSNVFSPSVMHVSLGGSNGSSSGSPLQLPKLQGGQDDDEVYQNMGV